LQPASQPHRQADMDALMLTDVGRYRWSQSPPCTALRAPTCSTPAEPGPHLDVVLIGVEGIRAVKGRPELAVAPPSAARNPASCHISQLKHHLGARGSLHRQRQWHHFAVLTEVAAAAHFRQGEHAVAGLRAWHEVVGMWDLAVGPCLPSHRPAARGIVAACWARTSTSSSAGRSTGR
jgi:hypothetical protein